jgi:hypothetical protein
VPGPRGLLTRVVPQPVMPPGGTTDSGSFYLDDQHTYFLYLFFFFVRVTLYINMGLGGDLALRWRAILCQHLGVFSRGPLFPTTTTTSLCLGTSYGLVFRFSCVTGGFSVGLSGTLASLATAGWGYGVVTTFFLMLFVIIALHIPRVRGAAGLSCGGLVRLMRETDCQRRAVEGWRWIYRINGYLV